MRTWPILYDWHRTMPKIEDRLLKSVIYLYKDASAAVCGDPGGSGFLVGIPCAIPETVFLFAVTNAHVVNDHPVIRTAGSPVISTPGSPDKRIIVKERVDWIRHPDGDDLVVTPVCLAPRENVDFYLGHVPSEWCVTPDNFTQAEKTREKTPQPRFWSFGSGEEVVMIGRFLGHDGVDENRPAVRFGNLAMQPPVPIQHSKGTQDSFVVECRSVSGFSGSPVFIVRQQATLAGQTLPIGMDPMSEPRLLGIDWGNLTRVNSYKYSIDWDSDAQGTHHHDSGMLVAVPAWKLSELLGSKEVRDVVRKAEDKSAKASEGVNLDFSPSSETEPGSLTKTADLMGTLLQVPKEQADEVHRSHQ